MALAWTYLDLVPSDEGHLPPLLLSNKFEADSYTIHLTDLTHIWSEQLDNAAILGRAEEEQTSIDPSESSNLQVLLDKIELALSSGLNTTLKLHVPSSPGRARPMLSLSLTAQLPGGLAPLVWPVHLSAAPQSRLTSHFTVPLLQSQNERTCEVEGLVEVLKEKDHVIQKLLDRMESQGTELSQVFPQAIARGGRKIDRKQAEEKVRGLGVFNMDAWQKGLDGGALVEPASIVQGLFSGHNVLDLAAGMTNEGADNWWEGLKGTTLDLSKKVAETRSKIPTKSDNATQEMAPDNDLEDRKLPSQKTSQSVNLSEPTASEDDEDDLNVSSQRSQHHPSMSPKKLGKLKGKKSPIKATAPSDTSTEDDEAPLLKPTKKPEKARPKKPSSPGEETTDDTDEPAKLANTTAKEPEQCDSTEDLDEEAIPDSSKLAQRKKVPSPSTIEKTPEEEALSKRSPSKSTSPEPAPKRKDGLGQLRGKKKGPSPSPSLSGSEEAPKPKKGKVGQLGGRKKQATPTPPSSQPATTPKRKLGALGGRNKAPRRENSDVDESEERGRSVKVEKEVTPPLRGISEERAVKRRAALKRELDEKATAPAKKRKRKF